MTIDHHCPVHALRGREPACDNSTFDCTQADSAMSSLCHRTNIINRMLLQLFLHEVHHACLICTQYWSLDLSQRLSHTVRF